MQRTGAVMNLCKELGHEPTAEQVAEIQELLIDLQEEVAPTT